MSTAGQLAKVLPAYDTKNEPLIKIPVKTKSGETVAVKLQQSDTFSNTTGTTLWLGGQVLSAYLSSSLSGRKSRSKRRQKAIDLGSGIGLTSITLALLGFDVVATDLPVLVDGIMTENFSLNSRILSEAGQITASVLDWTSGHDSWTWPSPTHSPPFDLIISSDSIYVPELVQPLLDTIHALCRLSRCDRQTSPHIYIAYEHRDDAQYEAFLTQAITKGFTCKHLHQSIIDKAVERAYGWSTDVYEGISILSMSLPTRRKNTQLPTVAAD